MDVLTDFLNLIYSIKVNRNAEDQTNWRLTRSRSFEVKWLKSIYRELCTGKMKSLPWRGIWSVQTPSNIIVVEWCCMWKKDGESIDHLLLQCDIRRVLVSGVMFIWGAVGHDYEDSWYFVSLEGAVC